jgi:hypothetical protein
MGNIDILLWSLIGVIILAYSPFLSICLYIITDRLKLPKIDNIMELEKRALKILSFEIFFSPTNAHRVDDILERLSNKKEKLIKIRKYLFIILPIFLFYFCISLFLVILKYFIGIEKGHTFPLKFPWKEIFMLISLNLWISSYITLKAFDYRINMFFKKMSELKDKKT